MKLYLHQFGNHRVRCQLEDPEQARALWGQFVPMVLEKVFGIHGNPETIELPAMNGQGFVFKGKLLTAFGQGSDLVIVDSAGLEEMAKRVEGNAPPKPPRRNLPVV